MLDASEDGDLGWSVGVGLWESGQWLVQLSPLCKSGQPWLLGPALTWFLFICGTVRAIPGSQLSCLSWGSGARLIQCLLREGLAGLKPQETSNRILDRQLSMPCADSTPIVFTSEPRNPCTTASLAVCRSWWSPDAMLSRTFRALPRPQEIFPRNSIPTGSMAHHHFLLQQGDRMSLGSQRAPYQSQGFIATDLRGGGCLFLGFS